MTEQEFVSLLDKICRFSGAIGGVCIGIYIDAVILKFTIEQGWWK